MIMYSLGEDKGTTTRYNLDWIGALVTRLGLISSLALISSFWIREDQITGLFSLTSSSLKRHIEVGSSLIGGSWRWKVLETT